MKKLLPLGTVFMDNSDIIYMIVGQYPIDENNNRYDYACCLYPQGFALDIRPIYVDSKDIKKICYYGNINYRS